MQILILVLKNMSKGDALISDCGCSCLHYLVFDACTIPDVTDEGVGNIKQHTLMGLMTFKLLAAHMQGHQGPKECFSLKIKSHLQGLSEKKKKMSKGLTIICPSKAP